MRLALILNLAGTVILFLSFQATSSNFRLITTKDGKSALCVDQRAMMIATPDGGWTIGAQKCPDWENARPAAVVNIEHPSFITLGFILTTFGFLLQFLSFPSPKSAAEMRLELKGFQKAEELKRKINPHTGLPHSSKLK